MKTAGKMQVAPQLGLDLRIPAANGSANEMENWCYDAKTKSWNNQVGYETFCSERGYPLSYYPNQPVDSIYCWRRHNSAQQWILFEAGGSLYYLNPSPGAITVSNTLDSSRTIPASNEPGSWYQPFGKYLVISNGNDGPLKWRAQKNRIYPVGWLNRPSPPIGTPPTNKPGDGSPYNFIEGTDRYEQGQSELGGDTRFKDDAFIGLGSSTANAENSYSWRVSFVNENGSESPISEPSGLVRWTTETITKGTNTYENTPCVKVTLPVGPTGTVARRLYRTKNNVGTDFFFSMQIPNNVDTFVMDFKADSQLGATAPSENDSVAFPASGARFSATYKNCLFLDGGALMPNRLYHSKPLQCDTYGAFDYFETGTSLGGDITALFTYYNSLFVFREDAIDLVRGDPLNGFELVPFVSGIGTRSPHTIQAIPNLGLMFLSTDGVYLLTGGLDGGSSLSINKISAEIDGLIERMSKDKLSKFVSIYSHQWREAHFYISTDGNPKLNTGIIFHQDSGAWTTRDNLSYKVGCLTTDKDGNIIYGANQAYDLSNNDPVTGIQVISRARPMGYVSVGSGEDIQYNQGAAFSATFKSQWMDMGSPFQKKQPKYLYLYIQTTGDAPLALSFHKDRNWARFVTADAKQMQIGDAENQPTYRETATPNTDEGVAAVWGQTFWQDPTITCIRYPIVLGSCSEFAFSFDTGATPVVFFGYAVEYQASTIETLRGKS